MEIKQRPGVCDIPCFCIVCKNLTMTLELGRIKTWRLPAFSALLMALRASLRTLVLTIMMGKGDSQLVPGVEVSVGRHCISQGATGERLGVRCTRLSL